MTDDAGQSADARTAAVPVPAAGPPGSSVPSPSPAPQRAPASGPDPSVMSLVDHLSELRSRIVRVILAVLAGSAIGFYLAVPIRTMLVRFTPSGEVQVLGPGDAFAITLRIAIVTGIVIAMPVILYQVWSFVSPGLTPAERATVRPWVPLALAFFALGCGVAWLILPYAIDFLLSFTDEVVRGDRLAAVPYFDFVTTLFLLFGLVMEFPILLFGLSRVGIVTSQRLRASRRFVILGIAIFAAIATPGGDLVSPFGLGGTMYLLYEATAFAIARTGR